MEIRKLDQIVLNTGPQTDSIDIPDCYGEFRKKNRLCSRYCSLSIRCCLMRSRHPKIDVLDRLLTHTHYAIKMH